ncbi:MAG: methyltransferase domain-containing protein [Acidimicrobiia bacterium]|nr:methyltransferase domain-containing protein [Acidimicrobiia bacterium]
MTPKYRFIIEQLEAHSPGGRVMEVGSSKGQLTAYLRAAGFDALGVDVSSSAVERATELFGDYYAAPDSPRVRDSEPFDAIVHAGTIGCVESPAQFTRNLLTKLRSGGLLAFNAPNVDVCRQENKLWPRNAEPPDLVTLFQPSWFEDEFASDATVTVKLESLRGIARLRRAAQRVRGVTEARIPSAPQATHALGGAPVHRVSARWRARLLQLVERSRVAELLPTVSAEFGTHVRMIRL